MAYLKLSSGALVFWMLYQLAPMRLILFTEHNINLNLYATQIAPQWVQNTSTLTLAPGGPLLAWSFQRLRKRGWRIDIPLKFASSLFFLCFGMLVPGIALAWWRLNGLLSARYCRVSVSC